VSGLDDDLAFLGDRFRHDHPLGPLTTYRVGGPARWFVEVLDPDELAAVCSAVAGQVAAGRDVPVLVVGRGSNLLVAERGLDGLAVQLGGGFERVDVAPTDDDGTTTVRAGGAVSLPVLARRTVAAGLSGFEWAVGVPGSVGGAVRMNAGGHGSDMAASLRRVRVVDLTTGEDEEVDRDDLALGYRTSGLRPGQVVVHADLVLQAGTPEDGERMLGDIVRWRREHQPGGQNAGSVFTNPPSASAGALVERAGLKGYRIGSAQVSPKHANFFQADPSGSADDVFDLMVAVAARVMDVTGVRLHPETCLVGFPDFDRALDRASDRASDPASDPAIGSEGG
jgi:UDP-N-acetylmuramate dehydrogenase